MENVASSSTQQLVSLIYAYHECNETKSEGRNIRLHLQNIHHISVPPLRRGQRFHDTAEYAFVKMNGTVKHSNIQERIVCPSCITHFETMDSYKEHLQTHTITSDDDDIAHHAKRRCKSFVSIPSRQKSNTVTFSTTSYLNPPNFARFPKNVVDALESVLDIETSTAKETNFDSSLSFPTVQSFLSAGLKQPLDDLP